MFNYTQLELKRYNFKKHWTGVVIATLISIGFVYLMNTLLLEGQVSTSETALDDIIQISREVAILITAIVINKSIVKEFNNGTMNVLFTYPLKKQEVILAKIAASGITGILTTLALTIMNLTLGILILKMGKVVVVHFNLLIMKYIFLELLKSITLCVSFGLLPVITAVKTKSTSMTIMTVIGVLVIFELLSTKTLLLLSPIILLIVLLTVKKTRLTL